MDVASVLPKDKWFHVACVWELVMRVICFGTARFPQVQMFVSPECAGSCDTDRRTWPRCLVWHGWCVW